MGVKQQWEESQGAVPAFLSKKGCRWCPIAGPSN